MWNTGQYDFSILESLQGVSNKIDTLLDKFDDISSKFDTFRELITLYWLPILAALGMGVIAVLLVKWLVKL